MKTCRKCGVSKDPDDFAPEPRGIDGRRASCRACCNAHQRNRYASDQEYRERKKRNQLNWLARNPWNEGRYRQYRDAALLRRYGIDQSDFEDMAAKQGGVCAICSGPPIGRSLIVDHDHGCCPSEFSCGSCIRGLLCTKCNVGLGNFRDRPELLLRAASYLTRSASCVGPS